MFISYGQKFKSINSSTISGLFAISDKQIIQQAQKLKKYQNCSVFPPKLPKTCFF